MAGLSAYLEPAHQPCKAEPLAQLRDAIDANILTTLGRMRRDLQRLEPGHGWQSEQTLHSREEFQDLVEQYVARTYTRRVQS